MKMIKFKLLGAVAIAAMLVLNSCDKCNKVPCKKGSCVEGTCNCDKSYEGKACDTMHSAKFEGKFDMFENCTQKGSSQTYEVKIAAHPVKPNTILITGLY
ncbi:MAG: hypothetical protein RLZZ165_2037, partial [Bacteroidota bacterium]